MSDSVSTAAASSGCESDSDLDGSSVDGLPTSAGKTTLIIRNLPNKLTRAGLLALCAKAGFLEDIVMLYLPIDFSTQAAFGYAFIFMKTPESAGRFLDFFNGFSRWGCTSASEKICTVSWCAEQEDLDVHVERYRNSPVMHESVPDSYKPILLEDGERVPFPSPSKRIRKPRVLGGRQTWNH
jgi:RNA recognition motif-containing protein